MRYSPRSPRPDRRRPGVWLAIPLGLVALLLLVIAAVADDGPMFRHPVSRTPDLESEDSQLSMLQLYVPATARDGSPVVLEYYADRDGDNQPDELVETREYAKPLISTYFDEVPLGAYSTSSLSRTGGISRIAAASGVEIGPDVRRDAFAAYSLDDGKTWKDRNLSESALESSFTLADGTVYPGDVPEVVHAVAGNKILVAWTSKYCDQGSPRYSVKSDVDVDGNGELDDPLYEDLFDVAGNQGSIDYTEWMHHGQYPFAEVGEIPFSCVWTARGTLQMVEPGQGSEATGPVWGVLWRKAERLTSGKRDAYYLAIDGVEGVGFALAWQEDPEGLRPGYGEGPGIGWSGATVNHKTDIWYSRVGWNEFDVMQDPLGEPTLDPALLDGNKPKVYERMAMPIRLSDNFNCLSDRVDQDGNPHPGFCFEDFDGNGTADLCAEVYPWTNSKGELKNICVTEDGRLLNGQTGSSRTRMMLEGYTRADGTKSAWVVLAYEETKGLGAGHTEEGEEEEEPLDIGKDIMYHSFDMSAPDIVAPGTMLNMPETVAGSDPVNPTIAPLILNDKLEVQYSTTIGRRPSLVVQPGSKIAEAAAAGQTAGMTSAILLYKDGAERQGGPSDVFMRRIELPAGFDPSRDNPYDPMYLACDLADTAIVTSSPSAYPASAYPNGVCLRGARNVSGTTALTFEPLDNTEATLVTAPDWHPTSWVGTCSSCHGNITDEGTQIEGLPSHGITERVLTWEQTPTNQLEEHWANKYEVAKGHRGFIDGDFVMLMYAHSPNWLATSHGHEPYNLYIRRSFDGGQTFTTTPASLGGTGTAYDQVFGVGDRVWTVSRAFAAGEFEPARNVSQITTNKETVLDPRYSPTNIGTQRSVERILLPDGTYQSVPGGLYADDVRDPSKFFAVFETGDATTVLLGGEADPLDLFASRATAYGDFWDTEDVFAQGKGLWEERWDWLENKKDVLSGEASIAGSPGGAYLWVVWNQWMEDLSGHVFESDPMFRRLWWDDEQVIVADAGMYTADEGETVTLTGSAAVRRAGSSLLAAASRAVAAALVDDLVYAWDLDMDGVFETAGRSVEVAATGAMQGVALKVCNGAGNCDVDQGWINQSVHVPRVWRVQTTANPSAAGVEVALTARFTDPGTGDSHRASIDWGDGTVEPATTTESVDGKGAALVVGGHVYADAGLYTVRVTVTDDDGHSGWDDLRFAVVYDRMAGNVDAPDLTFVDPVSGKELGLDFHGRYPNPKTTPDPTVPDGGFKLKLGKLKYEGTSYESMVVTPDGLVFLRGKCAFDGQGSYEFLVAAEVGKPDLVRVKIWRRNGLAREVLVDTQPGAADDALPTTPLVKGKVKIEPV